MSHNQQRQKIIDSWRLRAKAYHSLTRRWAIFSTMAERLIKTLKVEHHSSKIIIDLASGSGLVSELLLPQAPQSTIHMVDPAPEMLDLSKSLFGTQIAGYHDKAGHELGDLAIQADGILCSAAFHLMDESLVLPNISQSLKKGGVFVSNLWGHSFDETANKDQGIDWRPALSKAIQEFGQKIPEWPKGHKARQRSRDGLSKSAKAAGLELELCEIDEDSVPANFSIAFLAMYEHWPAPYEPKIRQQIIDRAMDLLREEEPCFTVRLRFRKS